MKIDKLTPNKKNPRKISDKQKDRLRKSLDKFGDIGGIVFNKRTNSLVGGHQRSNVLEGAEITIVTRYKEPTRTGTIAEGYAEINGEKFSYRAVDWDEKTEMEAMLSANKSAGQWDTDLLRLNFADFKNIDVDITGFEMPELTNMGIDFNVYKEGAKTDAQHIKDNPGPETEIRKEVIGESNKAFEDVKETTNVVGKRFVIIIDCPNEEIKQGLREIIKAPVEEALCKFF